MDIKQAQAVAQRLRKDYLAVARPFGEKAADTIDALIEEVERCDEEYNKLLAEKEAHAQEDIKRLHRIEQKVDALIVERDNLRAQLVKQLVKANTEPDWKDSDTLPSEGWKNPLYDFQTRLQFADGAISFRDKVIANLRQQLVRAQDNNEFALPGGGYVPPTPTPERAPAQRAVATDDPEIYEFWARNKEAEKQEPAKYSDIVSDGGMDPRNKFDVAPVQEPVGTLNIWFYKGNGGYDFEYWGSLGEGTYTVHVEKSEAPSHNSTCNETLRAQGKSYPRTCKKCGLGPCVGKPKSDTTPPAAPAQESVALTDAIHSEPTEMLHKWRVLELVKEYATPPAAQQEPPVWTATRLWNRRQLWTCPADIERDLMGGYTATPVATTQEPVAWMCSDESLVSKGYSRFSGNCEGAWNIPVYTTAKREWVGLTDEDIWNSDAIMSANSGYGANFETLRELYRAIEATLKEKNFS